MDFVKSHLEKMKLWPVEHLNFFSRSVLIQCSSGKKVSQKCSTGQSFIFLSDFLQNLYFNYFNKYLLWFLFQLANWKKINFFGPMRGLFSFSTARTEKNWCKKFVKKLVKTLMNSLKKWLALNSPIMSIDSESSIASELTALL